MAPGRYILAANMTMPLLTPNVHVALIHFPIALLLMGIAVEAVCLVEFRRSGARAAGRWMILLGAALGWPALYSGAYAIRTVAGPDFEMATWAEMRAGSPLANAGVWETLRTHLLINAGAVVLANIVVIGWLTAGERARRWLCAPGLALLLLSASAIVVGAWHGGELVYWHDATNVRASPGIGSSGEREVPWTLTGVVPPLDVHVLMAGVATAAALLAWAVAMRPREVVGDGAVPTDRIFAAFQPAPVEATAEPPRSTLGWVAALATLATAALGTWSLAVSFESWSPGVLLKAVVDRGNATGFVSRRLAHGVVGATLIVLPIVVGVAGRRCSGRVVPAIIGAALLVAIVGQTWLGLLLLLDSNSGSVVRLN